MALQYWRARLQISVLWIAAVLALSETDELRRIVLAQGSQPATVFAALQVIRQNHIDNPDAVRLLAAALNGLRQALSRAGVSQPLADINASDEATARGEFQARYNQAVTLAEGRLTGDQLDHSAAQAMAASLGDPDTFFLTPEQMMEAQLRAQAQPSFAGIGVQFRFKGDRPYVWHAYAGGPAARAGLRSFDRVLTVDGTSVQSMAREDFLNRVRGAEGTTVMITVQRPGQAAPLSLSITRAPMAPPAPEHQMFSGGIAYIRLPGFTQGSGSQMRQALEELQRQGLRGLILDLRFNTGGLFSQVDLIADLLLPSGLLIRA